MSLLDRLIGVCFIPLILLLAFNQFLHLSDFFLLTCRYVASIGIVRSFLSACFDYLRASQDCDIHGSFPGSPLVLGTSLERDHPLDTQTLDEYRHELKQEFYETQCNAGRISFAQKLTFLNHPSATSQHEVEDAMFAQNYQAAMAVYEAPSRPKTAREWVRRKREECEAAEQRESTEWQSTEDALYTSHPRGGRSLEPYQGSAHTRALALVSDVPPQPPPKFKALRGLAPRDSRGNIVWGPDPIYQACLAQEARVKQPQPGLVYRRWDTFALTPGEKLKMKDLLLSDRLNLWSYCTKQWATYIFEVHPPDNRAMFLDIRKRTYHEMWEWDYRNNIPLWPLYTFLGDGQTSSFGIGSGPFGSKNKNGGKGPFGAYFVRTGPGANTTNNQGGSDARAPPTQTTSTNISNTNAGGVFRGGPAPSPGTKELLFGKSPGVKNTGNENGAPLFPDPLEQPTDYTSGPSPSIQAGGDDGASSQTESNENELVTLWVPEAQCNRVQEWLENIKDTLGDFTYEQVKRDTNNPGDMWSHTSESAERYLRYIGDFASDENGEWDKYCVLSVSKAKKMGIKSDWWKKLRMNLRKVHEHPKTTTDSPLENLYVQVLRLDHMCSEKFNF